MKDFKKASKKAAEKLSNMTAEEKAADRQRFFDKLKENTNEDDEDIVSHYRIASMKGEFRNK